MTTPILQATEALSPEAEASTALIAGNKGPEPNPRDFLSEFKGHLAPLTGNPVW